MNNLTTRKIVLGLLMVLVLAFSVQGIADALTDPTITSSPSEFSTVNIGSTITINGLNVGLNTTTYRESLTVTLSGNGAGSAATGASFPDPVTSGAIVDTYTWQETSTADPVDHNNGTISIPSSVTITVGSQSVVGEIIVTVTWTKSDNTTGTAVRRFYAVNQVTAAIAISITDGGVNGFVIKPGGVQAIAFTATPVNIPVTFTSSSGNLFVQRTDGGVTRRGTQGTTLNTSSSVASPASVRIDLTATSTVTISHPSQQPDRVVYIYGRPTVAITDGSNQEGIANARLEKALSVRVTDSQGSNVAGIPVQFSVVTTGTPRSTIRDNQFIPVSGTTVYVGVGNVLAATLANTRTIEATSTYPFAAAVNAAVFVQTDSTGVAKVYLKLGAADDAASTEDATYVNATVNDGTNSVSLLSAFRNEIKGSERIPTIDIVSGNNQRADEDGNVEKPLVVVVKNRRQRIMGKMVTFTTSKGFLVDDDEPAAKSVNSDTNSSGEAEAEFFLGGASGVAEIEASITGTAGTIPYSEKVVFTVNGTGSTGSQQQPGTPTNTITISPSTIDGEPGEEVTIRVTSSPSGVFATLGSNDFGATRFSPQSDVTPFTSTLLLPVEEGTHSFFATGGVLTAGRASVTVEVEQGRLSITAIGTPEAGLQTFSISAVDADGDRAIGAFTARLSGTGFTSRDVEIAGGRGNARVTLPTTARLYTLTVSATGYEDGETPVRIAGTGQQQVADEDEEEVEEEVTVAAEPDSIEITGPSTRSGTVNEALDTPLLVRVLDDDGDGLEGARVFYRVSSGRGRLSARGNGRAIGVVTDDDGYARASFTPLDGGTITVRANTDDLSATVTFTITTGSASSASGARDSGTGGTPGMISPVVHVGAASRPPMLWVDGGAIYALVGASPQRFAASVDNALNIAIGGGKVYWTEKTGESGGTINSANLNGSDVTELTSIKAVPMGIAVDVAGSQLYWTNSRGRIQSADLDGSGITNVMQNLQSPMDLALAGGNAYWTQGNGSVRFVNLRGQKVVRNVSTGTDTPGSLVIGGGKVYWTEMTGESGGTVNSANLNGTGATLLASILAAPMGIAVDGSRSKLYWSNSRGRIQSANLDGSGITNVVSGLGSPSDMVLSNSIAAPAATTTTTTTTTASRSKYDLNSDGTVDNTDAGLVADAMGTSNARYDVNGDGTVNFLDLLLVFDNRDAGAAGAPTIVGMKMSAAQIDIIKEQIDLLIATNDRSPAAMRTLIYLQQLLVTARPEKTQLLANYPNPFNPETWIPYELATDTDVRITIYNTQGVVIRSLQFGHQSAGYYVGRDRAAYWDGRNALGEQVASGLYFYQLETDEMSLMRKMVILK